MAIRPTDKFSGTTTDGQHVQTSPLVNLPIDLILSILSYVPRIQDILACGQTCKAWNLNMRDNPVAVQCFWKYLLKRDFANDQGIDFQKAYKEKYAIQSNIIKKQFEVHTLQGHKKYVQSLLYAEGKLYSGSNDETIKIWDLEAKTCLYTIKGHKSGIPNLLIAEEKLISGSWEGEIKIWDLRKKEWLQTLQGHTDSITNLIYAEGKLISSSHDTLIKIWDLTTGACLHTFDEHENEIYCLLYASGKLISACDDGTIKIWDLTTNTCLHTIHEPEAVTGLVPVGEKFISGHYDGTIKIWDLATNTCVQTINSPQSITDLTLADGKLISCSYADKTLVFWDLITNKCICTLECPKGLRYAAPIFVDGKLISSNADKKIQIFDFNPRSTINVRFDAKYGNSLILCGEGRDLSWNPIEGKPLKCEGKDLWTIAFPKGVKAFKILWKKKNGSYLWEKGPNRTLKNETTSQEITNVKF